MSLPDNFHDKRMTTIKAVCTWGDGPDVMIIVEGKDAIARGDGQKYYIDLTAQQALDLADELIVAYKAARGMELSYEKYEKERKNSLRHV